jgi:hypothetical protein
MRPAIMTGWSWARRGTHLELVRLFSIYMDWRGLIQIERDFDLLGIETHSIHMDWGRTEQALEWFPFGTPAPVRFRHARPGLSVAGFIQGWVPPR